jgi:hypothetical protein
MSQSAEFVVAGQVMSVLSAMTGPPRSPQVSQHRLHLFRKGWSPVSVAHRLQNAVMLSLTTALLASTTQSTELPSVIGLSAVDSLPGAMLQSMSF